MRERERARANIYNAIDAIVENGNHQDTQTNEIAVCNRQIKKKRKKGEKREKEKRQMASYDAIGAEHQLKADEVI